MSYERPLTLAEARALLYRHATSDPQDLEGVFKRRLNEALERIYTDGFWEDVFVRVDINTAGYISSEIVTLPYTYECMLAITIDDMPVDIMGEELEFIPGGPGIEDAGEGGSIVIDLGFDATGSPVENLRSYKILADIGSTTPVEALLKKRFTYVENDTDTISPSNIGALKHALLAICFEDESDLDRSQGYWNECYAILQSEKKVQQAGSTKPNPVRQWGFASNKPHSIY